MADTNYHAEETAVMLMWMQAIRTTNHRDGKQAATELHAHTQPIIRKLRATRGTPAGRAALADIATTIRHHLGDQRTNALLGSAKPMIDNLIETTAG